MAAVVRQAKQEAAAAAAAARPAQSSSRGWAGWGRRHSTGQLRIFHGVGEAAMGAGNTLGAADDGAEDSGRRCSSDSDGSSSSNSRGSSSRGSSRSSKSRALAAAAGLQAAESTGKGHDVREFGGLSRAGGPWPVYIPRGYRAAAQHMPHKLHQSRQAAPAPVPPSSPCSAARQPLHKSRQAAPDMPRARMIVFPPPHAARDAAPPPRPLLRSTSDRQPLPLFAGLYPPPAPTPTPVCVCPRHSTCSGMPDQAAPGTYAWPPLCTCSWGRNTSTARLHGAKHPQP